MKMVHVLLLAKLFYLCCIISFRFVFVFVFNHIFLLGFFSVIFTAGPLEPLEVFAVNVFLVMFTYRSE